MAQSGFSTKDGDIRYSWAYGTQTVVTTTGLILSMTMVNGALYHAFQVGAIVPETSTVEATWTLQGSIEATPTNWFDIVGTTLTVAGTGTTFGGVGTTIWPLRAVRPNCSLVNTSCSGTYDVTILGHKG